MAGTKGRSNRQAAEAGRPCRGRRVGFFAAAAALALVTATGSPASARECVLLCWTPAPTTTTTVARATTTTTAPAPLAPLPPVTVAAALPGEDRAGALRLLDLANGERARAGLAPLASRDDVVAVALAHTTAMVAAGDIFHNDAYFGSAMKSRLDAVARGENVGVSGSVDDIHARLMASAGHRANILDRRFSVAGMAVMRDAGGQLYATQNLLQPRSPQAAPAAPGPAAAPAKAARRPAGERPRAAAPAPAAAPPAAVPEAPAVEAPAEEGPVQPPAPDQVPAPAPAPPPPPPAVTADHGASGPLRLGAGSLLFGVAGVVARLARRRLVGA